MKNFTMIARHGVKNNIGAYTLISSDYQTVTMKVKELEGMIKSKKILVNNLTVGPKGIESTNGALDKYTLINSETNIVDGTPRAVILDRVEQNGRLVGYTVFTQSGVIAELNIADASALAKNGLISNGKIKHTKDGDIVSSIGGNYPLRTIEISKAPKGEINVDILYFSMVHGLKTHYFGAIVSCTSATEMSKITDLLSKSNAKIVGSVVNVAGQKARESLAIKRMGANSIYGVFELSMLNEIIKAGGKLRNSIGSITISAIKYTDKVPDEATVKIDNSWRVVDNNIEDSEAAEDVKEYTSKLLKAFSSVKIEK